MGSFVSPLLAAGYRVVWFDQPGHGESGRGPVALPDFVRALHAIAAAHGRATDRWWRQHLADTFQAIVAREGLTRRHAVMKKIEKRWGGLPMP